MSRFRIEISKESIPTGLGQFTPDEQRSLLHRRTFDPAQHQIYGVQITLVDLPGKQGTRRTRFRKDFNRADRMLVEVIPRDPAIQILGIFPVSRKGVQAEPPSWEVMLEAGLGGILKLAGKYKGFFQRKNVAVMAMHTAQMAQWVLGKPFLAEPESRQVDLFLFVAVPADLPANHRSLRCYVTVSDHGRVLEKARKNCLLSLS